MLSDNIFRNVAQYQLIKSRNFPFCTCMKQNQKQKKAQPLRIELCNFDLEISLNFQDKLHFISGSVRSQRLFSLEQLQHATTRRSCMLQGSFQVVIRFCQAP